MNTIIFIPGLGENDKIIQMQILPYINLENTKVKVFKFGWANPQNSLRERMDKLHKVVSEEYSAGNKVSIIGISAGGSVAINIFIRASNKINKAVNVCGRLRKGTNVFPSLELASRRRPMFKDSVMLCEQEMDKLSLIDRNRILTIRPLIDEIVPVSLVSVKGAINKRILTVEHNLSILIALNLYQQLISDFLFGE